MQSIASVVNGQTISSHNYIYDAAHRRTQATLEDGSMWKYDYNDRNEVISGKRYWADWTPVAGQQFEYPLKLTLELVGTLQQWIQSQTENWRILIPTYLNPRDAVVVYRNTVRYNELLNLSNQAVLDKIVRAMMTDRRRD